MTTPSIQLAGCIILDPQQRILLLHRNKNGKIQWETPGGKLEPHESADQAAQRELIEEIGIKVNITSKIGEGTFSESATNYHYTWFKAELAGDRTHINLEPGFESYQYFSLSDLEKNLSKLSSGTKTLLELHQAQKINIFC